MKLLERLSVGASAVGIAVGLVLASSPITDVNHAIGSLLAIALAGICVIACLAIAAIAGKARALARLRYLALHLALVMAAFGLISTDWPFRARLLVSDPFIRPIAQKAIRGQQSQGTKHRAGLLYFTLYSRGPNAVLLVTGSCGLFFDTCGLVYSPNGRPQAESMESLQHLYGPWWHYRYNE